MLPVFCLLALFSLQLDADFCLSALKDALAE
jgi:hypothetical protein